MIALTLTNAYLLSAIYFLVSAIEFTNAFYAASNYFKLFASSASNATIPFSNLSYKSLIISITFNNYA